MKKRIALLLLAALSLASCMEEVGLEKGTFEYWSHEMCGEYYLSEVHWEGLAVDLNQDGIGRYELIQEMCGINGYWEPDYTALVEESRLDLEYNEPTLAVSFRLPYPDFRKDGEGNIYLNGTATLPMTIRYEYFEDKQIFKSQGRLYNFCYDESLVFLDSIEDIMITEFEGGRITVRMKCTMFYVLAQETSSNYLQYTFRKLP